MAKKKEEIPPYMLRALTDENLIEGMVEGDTHLSFASDEEQHTPIHFTSARVSCTRLADRSVSVYQDVYLRKNQALIYIPDTDYTRLPQMTVWEMFKTPLPGDFFIGQYSLEGKLMIMGRNQFMFQHEMPVMDVRIGNRLAGAGWPEIYAPLVVVNAYRLHFWAER